MTELDKLIQILLEQSLTIATAESCTGGLIASYLTEKPGSSGWFDRGFVTYSNLSKTEMLGIDKESIHLYGAVSEVIAESMALGALHHSAANVALAVTGIAGPEGGSKTKPVGTVCFGFAIRGRGVQSELVYFPFKEREQIRLKSCKYALKRMAELLTN